MVVKAAGVPEAAMVGVFVPVRTTSSMRMLLLPDLTNRMVKLPVAAAAGTDNALERYQVEAAAFAASLNKSPLVFAIFAQAEPFQYSTAKVACALALSLR